MDTKQIIQNTNDDSIEKVKLYKMSKGYNWEIQLCGKAEEQIKRIADLNAQLIKAYGSSSAAY